MKSCIIRIRLNLATFSSLLLLSALLLLSYSACDPSPDFQSLDVFDSSADAHLEDATSDTSPGDTSDTSNQPSIAPQVTILYAPDLFTNETTATLLFECDQPDCTFECSLNGPFFPCQSPMEYQALSDMHYTFLVRAQNSGGSVGPDAQHTWTVDTHAPLVTNLTGPPALTNQTTASFEFECDEDDCTFECALNDSGFKPCAAPAEYPNLSDAAHTFSVRATDLAGNTGEPASSTWSINTDAPTVTVTAAPENRPYFSTATFSFTCSKPPCTFECSIDAGTTYQTCTSPQTYENLERKQQTFIVRATDTLGNQGTSTPHKWTVTWPKWTQVAVGGEHACAIMEDGTLWCWGRPDLGSQLPVLGHPTILSSQAPIQVETALDWQYIAANGTTSCGIRNGHLYCWGLFSGGVSIPDSVLKTFTGTNWKSVSPGYLVHICGIRGADQLWCWGMNHRGQLGSGTGSNNVEQPIRIGTDTWRSIITGHIHTCGVTTSNKLYCWGAADDGQAGQPGDNSFKTPTQVPPTSARYEAVYAGAYHTLAITTTPHTARVFGKNNSGQLGIGNYDEKVFNATQVSINRPTMFAGGDDFSCAVDQDKKVLCSGANDVGQLGRGNITLRHNTFASIKAPNTLFTQVDAAKKQACALDTDGNIWCWGGKAENSTPTKIPWPY